MKLNEILNDSLKVSPGQSKADQSWLNKSVSVHHPHPQYKDKTGVVKSVSKTGEWVYVFIKGAKDPKGRRLAAIPFSASDLKLVDD